MFSQAFTFPHGNEKIKVFKSHSFTLRSSSSSKLSSALWPRNPPTRGGDIKVTERGKLIGALWRGEVGSTEGNILDNWNWMGLLQITYNVLTVDQICCLNRTKLKMV